MNFWELNILALIAFALLIIAFAAAYYVFNKTDKSKH